MMSENNTTKQNQWTCLKNQYGVHAYSKLEYKIHFENGGTSGWSRPTNNKFVEDNLNILEWAFI